jgi:hypothetical protein
LRFVDWELNGDPFFYENHHLTPMPVDSTPGPEVDEKWIFYNTPKFSGKKLVLHPGQRIETVERGVYNVLVWSGQGSYGGQPVRGGEPGHDELLVVHAAAVVPHLVENDGDDDLVVFKFFGPDINDDVPVKQTWA